MKTSNSIGLECCKVQKLIQMQTAKLITHAAAIIDLHLFYITVKCRWSKKKYILTHIYVCIYKTKTLAVGCVFVFIFISVIRAAIHSLMQ